MGELAIRRTDGLVSSRQSAQTIGHSFGFVKPKEKMQGQSTKRGNVGNLIWRDEIPQVIYQNGMLSKWSCKFMSGNMRKGREPGRKMRELSEQL